jgi:uncharacterized protein
MMWSHLLFTAAAAGVLSMPHCFLMCGPLAAAGCQRGKRWRAGGGYFLGRMVAYSAAGAGLGRLGQHALCWLPRRPLQLLLSFLLALYCLWRAWRALRPKRPRLRALGTSAWYPLPKRGLGLGLVTGLLPCGALVAAWMLAASSGDPVRGAAAMLVFAAASSPALILAVLGKRWLTQFWRCWTPRAQASAWLLLSVLVAARGLLGDLHAHHGS